MVASLKLLLNKLVPAAKEAMGRELKGNARLKYGTAVVLAELHPNLQNEFLPQILAGEAGGATSPIQKEWIRTKLAETEYVALVKALSTTMTCLEAEAGKQQGVTTASAVVPPTSAKPTLLNGMLRVDYYKQEGPVKTKLRQFLVSRERYVELYKQGLLAWQIERVTRPTNLPNPEEVRAALEMFSA